MRWSCLSRPSLEVSETLVRRGVLQFKEKAHAFRISFLLTTCVKQSGLDNPLSQMEKQREENRLTHSKSNGQTWGWALGPSIFTPEKHTKNLGSEVVAQ